MQEMTKKPEPSHITVWFCDHLSELLQSADAEIVKRYRGNLLRLRASLDKLLNDQIR
jgi:hypothetical protein